MRASCAHLVPRSADFNRSTLVGVEGKETKTAVIDNTQGTHLHQFLRWINDHTSKISGRQNGIVFLTAVEFPAPSKLPTNIDLEGGASPSTLPRPRRHCTRIE